MTFPRSVIAIIAGYLVFALSGAAFFLLTKQDPHATTVPLMMIVTTVYGMFFAALGGYAAARIAVAKPFRHAASVWLLISAGALASLITSPATDAKWSQIATLLLMAPSALLGGWFAARERRTQSAAEV